MKYALIVLAALFAASCAKNVREAEALPGVIYYNLPDTSGYEFKLQDGTRCVMLRRPSSVALACEWRRPVVE